VPVVAEPVQLTSGDEPGLACGDAFTEHGDVGARPPARIAETGGRPSYSVHSPGSYA